MFKGLDLESEVPGFKPSQRLDLYKAAYKTVPGPLDINGYQLKAGSVSGLATFGLAVTASHHVFSDLCTQMLGSKLMGDQIQRLTSCQVNSRTLQTECLSRPETKIDDQCGHTPDQIHSLLKN